MSGQAGGPAAVDDRTGDVAIADAIHESRARLPHRDGQLKGNRNAAKPGESAALAREPFALAFGTKGRIPAGVERAGLARFARRRPTPRGYCVNRSSNRCWWPCAGDRCRGSRPARACSAPARPPRTLMPVRSSSAEICRARSAAMCSRSRIIVSREETLRAFSPASNRFKRSAESRGFIVRYPQRVRTCGFQSGTCQKVSDGMPDKLSKRYARRFGG